MFGKHFLGRNQTTEACGGLVYNQGQDRNHNTSLRSTMIKIRILHHFMSCQHVTLSNVSILCEINQKTNAGRNTRRPTM